MGSFLRRGGAVKVVVLRPEPGASVTAARARAGGLAVVVTPLFVVRALDWSPPDEAVDALMLTSANAVRHAGAALADYASLPAWVVGEATAAAARAAGLRDVRVAGGSAEALVAAIPIGTRILHLAGREHQPHLPPDGIRRLVYAAEPSGPLPPEAVAALADGAVALLHSARAAARFRALSPSPETVAIAVLSPAVAAAAGDGWRLVAVAARPDDDALLAAVCATPDCA